MNNYEIKSCTVFSPIHSAQLPSSFRLDRRYVDIVNNANNCDFFPNGEANLLREFVENFAKQDCLIFDIGSNIGELTSYFLSLKPSVYINLFEPSRPTFEALSCQSCPDTVTLNNFALGSRFEKLLLNIQGTSGTNPFLERSSLGIMQKQIAIISTLDHYCDSRSTYHIDFMKIEVEGFNLSVLRGAVGMLFKGAIGMLQFEYRGTYLDARIQLRDIWELLTSYGYSIVKVFPNSLKYIVRYSQSLESYKYTNWIATYSHVSG